MLLIAATAPAATSRQRRCHWMLRGSRAATAAASNGSGVALERFGSMTATNLVAGAMGSCSSMLYLVRGWVRVRMRVRVRVRVSGQLEGLGLELQQRVVLVLKERRLLGNDPSRPLGEGQGTGSVRSFDLRSHLQQTTGSRMSHRK